MSDRQPWELTDEQIDAAVAQGAAQYKHERDTAIAWGDEEYHERRAIATAAQKWLVEWLDKDCTIHHENDLVPHWNCVVCWRNLKAALGVK